MRVAFEPGANLQVGDLPIRVHVHAVEESHELVLSQLLVIVGVCDAPDSFELFLLGTGAQPEALVVDSGGGVAHFGDEFLGAAV